MSTTMEQFERRMLFKGVGGALGAFWLGGEAQAQQAASGLSKRDIDMNGNPAVFDAAERGNFDLEDPKGNRLATLKVTNNLVGKKTYVAMMGRVFLGPQGKAGAAIHGFLGLWTWQLFWPDPKEHPNAPPGTVQQKAMYTGVMTDPTTFKPAAKVYNHYLKKEVETKDSAFAESYLLFPKGGGTSIDRPEFMDSDSVRKSQLNPYVRWGNDLSIYLTGIFQNEGPNQPRMDGSCWTSDYKRVMDPKDELVTTDYNFAGLMRAWERPWIGIGKDDNAQILFNTKGTKVHSVDDFPDIVKEYLVKKYPDRV